MAEATRVTTIRLPEELAEQVDLVARGDGITTSAVIREALSQYVAARTADREFRARLAGRIARDQALLTALADGPPADQASGS